MRQILLAIACAVAMACGSAPTAPPVANCAKLMDSTLAQYGNYSAVDYVGTTEQIWTYGPNSGGAFTYFKFTWPPCVRTGPTMVHP